MMKTVFMGTPDFSVSVLKALCESGNTPVGVVTRSDKPAGRGNKIIKSPVKIYAEEKQIDIRQPEKLSDPDFQCWLKELDPDIIVVVAYGRILPESVLNLPRYGCINAHASLLPAYRGAAPMQRAIMDGCTETGVTVMKMDKGLDTGDMILVKKTPIKTDDDLETIHDRLAELSGEAIIEAMQLLECGKAVFTPQNSENANYAEKIVKEDEILDFDKPAFKVSCQIRALSPFPYAHCIFNGKKIKITKATLLSDYDVKGKTPGEVITSKGQLIVACKEGALVIEEVFPESKKKMKANDFVNGSQIKPGDIFISEKSVTT